MMGLVEFTYTKREDNISICITQVFESIFLEVQINKNKPIIIGVVCRHNAAHHAYVDMLINKIIKIQDKLSN